MPHKQMKMQDKKVKSAVNVDKHYIILGLKTKYHHQHLPRTDRSCSMTSWKAVKNSR